MTQSSGPRPTLTLRLRKLAKGMDCLIRLPGVCNRDSATTVLCHFRMAGLSGYAVKPHDIFAAWGCSSCHAYVDSHHDALTQLAFAQAVFRTQQKLIDMGELDVERE